MDRRETPCTPPQTSGEVSDRVSGRWGLRGAALPPSSAPADPQAAGGPRGGGGSRGSAPLAAGPGGRKGPESAAPPRGRRSLSPGARSADKCSAAARAGSSPRGRSAAQPCSTRTPGRRRRRAPWGCHCTRPRRCCLKKKKKKILTSLKRQD